MLMITVMAFATDYKGQLDYILTTRNGDLTGPSYAQGTLKIEPYAGGKYTVTATGCDLSSIDKDLGNWDEIICEGVEGTTDANGVTTIDVAPYAFRGSDNAELKNAKLFVKFKDDKAYATFAGTYNPNFFTNYTLKYTFGVDEGFDGGGSTGGGETGGETSSIVTVKENFQSTEGSSWGENVTIDWNTQKLVVSVNLASTGSDKGFLGVTKKGQTAGWNNYGIIFYNTNGSTVQGYAPGQPNNANTNQVTKGEDPVRFEISKDGGVKCQGNVVISASNIAHLTNQSEIVVGAADKPAGALYNYIKVVPLDWKETTEPEVTVVATKKFNDVDYSNTWSQAGTANVTFEEMSDETIKMKFTTDGINISADALTKGTDDKGRTTYTGEAVNDAMSTITYTIKAVVYTEGTAEKLYMTMEANSGVTFNVGVDPDYVAPVTYKNTLYVVENAKLLVETPDAEVVLQDKGEGKYDVTLPTFTAGEMTVPSITFEATKADNKLTASNVSVPDVYSGDAAVVTMDGTFESDKLFSSLTVKCGEWFDYEVGYGIKPFVATTKEYTAEWANVKVGDAEPVNFQNAKADYTEFAKGQYSLTYKDLTIGGKKIGDFTIKYVHMDKMGQLSTTAAAGTWTRVEADQDVASLGAEASISGFEGVIGGTGDGTLFVKFTINAYGTVAVDFGHKYEAPEPPVAPDPVDVVEEGFKATGESWKKEGVAIDWDTQYIAAKLDLSTCKVSSEPENVLAVGTDITGWNDGPHYFFYYNKADKVLQYNYLHKANKNYNNGFANLSRAYIQLTDEVVTIEISKQGGLKINGESALVKYVDTAKDPSTNSTESWTTEDLPTVFSGLWALNPIDFGGCQGSTMSNATYKYVKVVPLGWKEPVTPPSVNDTKTFNEALYMVQGTTSTKVADAKVVVKEMSDNTVNMSLQFNGNEYTSTELVKGTDEKNRTTYTGKVSKDTQTFDVAGVVYEKETADRLYMTMTATGVTFVVGENPDVVTPEVTEVSNETYTSNLKMTEGEEDVVDMPEAKVNIVKYSDESYKVTLKDVEILNKTQDLVFVGKALAAEDAPTAELLTIKAKSDEATTTNVFGEQVNATFEITTVSADEIKMDFSMESGNFSYEGKFNYTDEEVVEPEVYTSNLHIYDAAAPETDLFQADQAKVEFLATETGEFKLTLKDVTLNEKTQDLVFTGALPTPQPGGQDPLAEEGEGEVTPAEPAMVLNATADEATATFLGTTSATAVFNVIMNDEAETENDAFALTFTITAGEKTLGGEFNYKKKDPVEKYPVNFDKTAKSTHNSRALNSFSLQQTGKDKQTESVYASKAAYEDHTSKVFTVEAGSELTASFDYTGEWMHSFVYIDFDNDGQFSYKEGQWDQTGTDLVAFSFYSLDSNPKNDASGYNSVGDELTGDARNTYVAPSFKAPAKAGEYRIRFKFDWNCILPGGSSSILSDGGGVWDATLKVVEPVVDGISSINAEVANGEAQLFTIDGVKLNKLQKGLNIVRTADGKVKKVLVK